MKAWFTPDAANYFSRVSKGQILAQGRPEPAARAAANQATRPSDGIVLEAARDIAQAIELLSSPDRGGLMRRAGYCPRAIFSYYLDRVLPRCPWSLNYNAVEFTFPDKRCLKPKLLYTDATQPKYATTYADTTVAYLPLVLSRG